MLLNEWRRLLGRTLLISRCLSDIACIDVYCLLGHSRMTWMALHRTWNEFASLPPASNRSCRWFEGPWWGRELAEQVHKQKKKDRIKNGREGLWYHNNLDSIQYSPFNFESLVNLFRWQLICTRTLYYLEPPKSIPIFIRLRMYKVTMLDRPSPVWEISYWTPVKMVYLLYIISWFLFLLGSRKIFRLDIPAQLHKPFF